MGTKNSFHPDPNTLLNISVNNNIIYKQRATAVILENPFDLIDSLTTKRLILTIVKQTVETN